MIFALLSIIYAVLILIISLSPLVPTMPLFPFADKLIHCFIYFVFAFLLTKNTKPVYAFAIAVSYGVLIEFLQPFVGREFELLDILANSIGATIAVTILPPP